MDINALKRFARTTRIWMIDQVTTRLDRVLAEEARAPSGAITALRTAIERNREAVIEQAACTWFNRFTALRFMDVMGLTTPHVVREAAPCAHEGHEEAYRLHVLQACHDWHDRMPFLFAGAGDYTDLLMPDGLLAPDGFLARLRAVMTEAACQHVEIIGWLYQFYISAKKDAVFAGLKRNIKITPANIPAATQLFTPHWIVRYLVENSLGRLWLRNHPQSALAAKMAYYIAPSAPETDVPPLVRPEDIRLCDPACGAGHMLTYSFDLLYEIYAEAGHAPHEIPGLILTHNLTGIEIDAQAAALAAFALLMKAATRLGRQPFLHLQARPAIVVMRNVTFNQAEMADIAVVLGRDLFTPGLRTLLGQFEQARNLGALIVPAQCDVTGARHRIAACNGGADPRVTNVLARALAVLRMAEALAPRYHVTVANPPYMGAKGMNDALAAFIRANHPHSRCDLFAVFMERALGLTVRHGLMAMITMQSWMFLASYEKLRARLLAETTIMSMAHLGERAFDSIGGAVVSTTAFVIGNTRDAQYEGTFIRLVEGGSEAEKKARLQEAIQHPECGWRHQAAAEDFEQIPGQPIAYWLSENFRQCFSRFPLIGASAAAVCGMTTGENARFVRAWHEVDRNRLKTDAFSPAAARQSGCTWFPYAKGGEFRKWYGNADYVVNWHDDGRAIVASGRAYPRARQRYFSPSVSWSFLSSAYFGVRQQPPGFIFDMAGCSLFPAQPDQISLYTGALCAKTAGLFLQALNPTLNFQVNNVASIPLPEQIDTKAIQAIVQAAVKIGKCDWDGHETSWDFTTLPLLSVACPGDTLARAYTRLRARWQGMTDAMARLEEDNNRLFINAYGLHDELTPDVPARDITLTCNPAYRYGGPRAADGEARLRADTVAELLHYAVGCLFGRYSLDAPGLILARQGAGLEAYFARVPHPRFAPVRDNVIPVLEEDGLGDDIVTAVCQFLRVSFGVAQFHENLAFIERALGKDLRRWFSRDFFDDHVKRYRKRPVYWMFSSPDGHFNALVYMHRYQRETVSTVLASLRQFIARLAREQARLHRQAKDAGSLPHQRSRAQKESRAVAARIKALGAWADGVLHPLAQQGITLDLDAGVRRNYRLFAGALKPIRGVPD
ncbi:BREX-1 system adenine-specific DNA-methyltransferase PglX [Komagataeibacter xylinus]|uniref:BREX-1 system adenine-specific DNA-methyltransferase PglX n=1 Tax=Komagataeibacter xylinus TaxID=28448 RepID=UPI001030AC50|nr:BREX-1 system adenine-specific DNA-methyltransferase PglX [Komagataeibacter xylinus]